MSRNNQVPISSQAAERDHDEWFRSEVQKTLDGLKDGSVKVVSEDEHDRRWLAQRATFISRAHKPA
jgi:hypothetical protein